jgi:nitrogen PTS system EIIA component
MFIENLDRNNIILVDAADKENVLKKLCKVVCAAGDVELEKQLEEKIFHRETLMSTGIGLGVGIPHVRCAGVKNIIIAMAVSDTPVTNYESIDGFPIRIVIMIVVPENCHRQHIQILNDIVHLFKNTDKREGILSAHTPDEIYRVLQ